MQFLKKVWTRIVFDEARAVFHGMGGLIKDQKYISIYIYIYFAWLSVYLYPSKRLNMTQLSAWNVYEICDLFFDFLQYIYKENMFTIKMEAGHEAP